VSARSGHFRNLKKLAEIEEHTAQLKAKMELRGGPGPPGKTSAARQRLANRKPQGRGAFGVTRIPGRRAGQKLLGEVGPPTLKMVRSAAAFAAWLGFCPNHEISPGKVLSGNTKKVKHPAARSFQWRHNPCKGAGRGWGDCTVVCEPG
jgi:hypothetical protein